MHNSPKVLIVLLLLLGFSFCTSAQSILITNGTVQDSSSGKVLAAVSIVVYHNLTGKIISGTTTTENGNFNLETKDTTSLRVAFSHIGYVKKVISWSRLSKNPIQLVPSAEELKDVVVKANKTITSFEDDRIKYDVQSMQDIKYLTIDQLMNRLPFLLYDEKSVKFMNENVTILIDNKNHPLYSSAEGLKQLPLHAIEKIELIIAPSTRAEGTRVMNITLKSNYFLGWNGRINADVSKISYGTGGRVSYWSKKIGGDISLNQSYVKSPHESITTINNFQTGEAIRLNQNRVSRASTYQTYASLYLNISDKNTIDVSTSLGWKPSISQSVATSQKQLLGNGDPERLSESQPQESDANSYSVGLNYTRKFKKKGRELYFLNNYFNQNQESAYELKRLRGFDQTILDYLENYKKLGTSKELTSELVFTDNLGKNINYSVGSKLIYRNNDSDQNQNTVTPDTVFSNNLIFATNQLVSSTFLDLQFKIKGISLNGGTRFDYSRFSFERFSEFDRDYYNVPINLSASRKLGKKHLFQLAYSRRIYRPSLDNFTPFSVADNSYVSKEGNIDLQPETTNNVSTGLFSDFKFGSIGFNLSYSRNKDLIRDFYEDQDGQLVAKSANLDLNQSIGLDISAQIRFSPKLQLSHSSNGNLIFQKSGVYRYKTWVGYINDQLIYRLTKKQTLVLSAVAYSPHLEIQGRSQSIHYINTSLSYYLNLDLSKTIPANLGVRIGNPWMPKGLPSYNYRDTEAFRYYQSSLKANYLIGISFSMNFMGKHYGQRFNRNRGINNDDLQSRD